MAGKPKRVAALPSSAASPPEPQDLHPSIALLRALRELAGAWSDAKALMRQCGERITLADALAIGTPDETASPHGLPRNAQARADAKLRLRVVLARGREHGDTARHAMRAGGARVWDDACGMNQASQPRSVDLHTRLLDSDAWLRTFATWAEAEDKVYANEDAEKCAAFSAWFGRAYDELIAVLDMRGVDPLLLLGARDVWPVDELPESIDADTLRCLDDDGFIEARGVVMNNQSKFPGDQTPPIPSRGAWCSPIREPSMIGNWDSVLAKTRRDTWHHPAEVRVSERGRAQLSRLRRGSALPTIVTIPPTGAGSGTNTEWKDIQARLIAKRDRGEPYAPVRDLAKELKCSDSTIRKAIKASEALRGWQKRHSGPKAAPKAIALDEVVTSNAQQATEPAPADLLTRDDEAALWARLLDRADPASRAQLNAMGDSERRALVQSVYEQDLDGEPSPLDSDQPGKRPRRVTHPKRA